MSEIRFRLAKPSDAKQIANCHWHVRDRYTQGIFLSLGESFLRAYYKVILDDPWEVVICAEREDGKIVGFGSTTLDAAKQANNLRKHKISLGLAAMRYLLIHPSLFRELWLRYKSLKGGDAPRYVHMDGVRGEYWCWLKGEDSLLSIDMDNAKEHILYDLGYRVSYSEVDKNNTQVYKYHLKKYELVEEITLPDGRVRGLFKSILKPGK